jgi:hypothetical protein
MSAPTANPDRQAALSASTAALRRLAAYELPAALDRRLLDLAERKDELTPDERAELSDWVAFAQTRSVEKLEAEVALRRLAAAFPDASNGS